MAAPTLQEELDAMPPAGRGGVACQTCNLPAELRALIERDRESARPHSFGQLSRFLESRGHRVQSAAVASHFRKGHHRGE